MVVAWPGPGSPGPGTGSWVVGVGKEWVCPSPWSLQVVARPPASSADFTTMLACLLLDVFSSLLVYRYRYLGTAPSIFTLAVLACWVLSISSLLESRLLNTDLTSLLCNIAGPNSSFPPLDIYNQDHSATTAANLFPLKTPYPIWKSLAPTHSSDLSFFFFFFLLRTSLAHKLLQLQCAVSEPQRTLTAQTNTINYFLWLKFGTELHVARHTHRFLHRFQATQAPDTQTRLGAVLAGLYKRPPFTLAVCLFKRFQSPVTSVLGRAEHGYVHPFGACRRTPPLARSAHPDGLFQRVGFAAAAAAAAAPCQTPVSLGGKTRLSRCILIRRRHPETTTLRSACTCCHSLLHKPLTSRARGHSSSACSGLGETLLL